MPVYNGEKYIRDAIDSVLAQTFDDLELVISDNASTDRTEEICREYVARDRRVRYARSDVNRGAALNYNRTFELAPPSDYFKWQPHDDTLTPDYLERCVAALDANPDAVLCDTNAAVIDETGRRIGLYDSGLTAVTTAARASDRFREYILRGHSNLECMGLVRRGCLDGSVLMDSYYLAERVYVANLALKGRFVRITEPLFGNREHALRATNVLDRVAWAGFHNTGRNGWKRFGQFALFVHYVKIVSRVPDRAERLRCYGHLLRWWTVSPNFLLFLSDLVGFISPSLYRSIRRLKHVASGRDATAVGIPSSAHYATRHKPS
jgi:glycosyltransferase involved in cell wall biosynthesis